MPVAFTNFSSTQLAGGITDVATSMTVSTTTGANFPTTAASQWFYVVLTDSLVSPTQREIIKVTTRVGDTFSVIVRARDGTVAQAWPSGTYVQLRLTAGTFADLTAQYANNTDNLSALSSALSARTNLGLGSIATQSAAAVAITGGAISNVTETNGAFNGTVGATTPSTGAFTTVAASGVITSTVATGTAPLTVASTTVVGNLNVSQLLGATWTAPSAIGSVTPNSGAFTTLSASGAVSGAGFTAYLASPPAIGGGTPAAGTFAALNATTIRAVTSINMRGLDNASATNSGFGEGVLAANAGGTSNTGAGYASLASNTTGSQNTAVGFRALNSNTTGLSNTACGNDSLKSNTTGLINSAFGYLALNNNRTGSYNIAIGNQPLYQGLSTVENIAIGSGALGQTGLTVTAGAFIIGVSYTIQSSGTTVFTSIGAADNNPGTVFTATGVGAGTGTASSNTGYNIGIGYSSLSLNKSGQENIAIGDRSQYSNSMGSLNISLGQESIYYNQSSSNVVAIGYRALNAVGTIATAGAFVTGVSYTIASIGSTDFTLIGSANNNVNTVFTATGAGAGTGTATPNADKNIGVGYQAGNTIVGGTNNTIIGADADVTSASQINATAIGYQATATIDNQVVLGNASVVQYKLPGTAAHVSYAGSYSSAAPVTETAATHTVAIATSSLICNRAGTITVTLPSAATYPGRELRIRTITANTVVSNASNVVPLIGGAAGTAICAGVAGSWAHLHSDGTNWQIMAGA